jgi:hypothetical protein
LVDFGQTFRGEFNYGIINRLALRFRSRDRDSGVIVRGSIMYLSMLAILRFVGRRQAGHFGPADLLVIVMIADAATAWARIIVL